jgi:hypothetical protein
VITASSDKIKTMGRWWHWTQTFWCFHCEKKKKNNYILTCCRKLFIAWCVGWEEKGQGLFGICGWYRGHKTKRF